MKVSSKRTNQVQVNKTLLETTHRLTMSLRLPRRRKSSRDMVMSLMENLENVKRKSKPLLIHLIISRWETKITETNSSKVLKELILRRNKFSKTSAVPLLKLSSRKEESSRNCKKITMTITVNCSTSSNDRITSRSKTKLHRKIKNNSRKISWLKVTSLRKLSTPCKRV